MDLIGQFVNQLRDKDEEYNKALKKQNDDVDELIKLMGQYFKQTREDYDERLKDIEGAFYTERVKICNRNRDDINALFKE